MNEVVTPHRIASQPQSLYYSFEKAGLVLQNQPIPWRAESVVVEGLFKLTSQARKKIDFTLRVPGLDAVHAESLRKDESSEKYRLFFRLNPPPTTTTAEIFWRHHLIGKIELPVLTPDEFVRDLRIVLPTVFVQIGGKNVAAQTFVVNQCKGLTASAIVRSPTSLVPLFDLPLRVVFRWDKSARSEEVVVPLVTSQLAGKEAMVAVSPPRLPRKSGDWSISWMIGDRTLATQRVRTVTAKTFLDSLRIADTRFVFETEKSKLQVRRQLPPLNEVLKAGPCFLVASHEAGIAGIVNFQIIAQVPGAVTAPRAMEQTVMVTDGPTLISPSMLDASELSQIVSFDLRHRNRLLGSLPLSPVPAAMINGEGGFKAASEFLWSNTAEEELLERLGRLMEVDRNGES